MRNYIAHLMAVLGIVAITSCSDDTQEHLDSKVNDSNIDTIVHMEAGVDTGKNIEGGIDPSKVLPKNWDESGVKPPKKYSAGLGDKVVVEADIPKGDGGNVNVWWRFKVSNTVQGYEWTIGSGTMSKGITNRTKSRTWETGKLPDKGNKAKEGEFTIEYKVCNSLNKTLCKTMNRTVELKKGNLAPVVRLEYVNGGSIGGIISIYFDAKDPEGKNMTYKVTKVKPTGLGGKWLIRGPPQYAGQTTSGGGVTSSDLGGKNMADAAVEIQVTDADGKSTAKTFNFKLNKYCITWSLSCGSKKKGMDMDTDIANKLFTGVSGYKMSTGTYEANKTASPTQLKGVQNTWLSLSNSDKQQVAKKNTSYKTLVSTLDTMTKGSCDLTQMIIK